MTADASGECIDAVRRDLLAWFEANARDLPWRRTRNPYRILVSEVMLQQTQVDRVRPYYEAFLARFPDESALADAPASEVIRMWAGLGYNRRAVNLQRAVQHVVRQLDGEWPRTVDGLRALPGIGPYTAGAVACFAFEQDVGFLDTNMRRVLHRVFHGPEGAGDPVPERDLVALASRAVPPGDGWRWNQALIEFGALQCTARKPACVVCPLQRECRAFPDIQGVIAQRPTRRRAQDAKPFVGSSRYYRGRVVDVLREAHVPGGPGLGMAELGERVRGDFDAEIHLDWLREVVSGLSRDGLLAMAEDGAAYDAGTGRAGSIRVRLPD